MHELDPRLVTKNVLNPFGVPNTHPHRGAMFTQREEVPFRTSPVEASHKTREEYIALYGQMDDFVLQPFPQAYAQMAATERAIRKDVENVFTDAYPLRRMKRLLESCPQMSLRLRVLVNSPALTNAVTFIRIAAMDPATQVAIEKCIADFLLPDLTNPDYKDFSVTFGRSGVADEYISVNLSTVKPIPEMGGKERKVFMNFLLAMYTGMRMAMASWPEKAGCRIQYQEYAGHRKYRLIARDNWYFPEKASITDSDDLEYIEGLVAKMTWPRFDSVFIVTMF